VTILTNYVPNPGAEGATASLETEATCTVSMVSTTGTSWPARGTFSYSLAMTATTAAAGRLKLTNRAAATSGQRWHARVRLRAASGNTGTRAVRLVLRFYNIAPGATAGTTLLDVATTLTLAAGAISDVTVTGVAPASTLSVGFVIQRDAGTGAAITDVFHADDVALIQSTDTITPDYFDGSTSAFDIWTGTANASTSQLYVPTITLAALVDAPAPRVDVFLQDAPTFLSSFTVWRTAEGRTFRVRGLVAISTASGIGTVQDYEAPFGILATYRAEFFDSTGASVGFTDDFSVTLNPLAMEAWSAWFHNAIDPASSVKVELQGQDRQVLKRPLDYEIFRVRGRSVGVAVFNGGRHGYEGLVLDCVTLTAADESRFDDLFGEYDDDETVPIICVRSMPGSRLPATLFAVVGSPAKDFPDGANLGERMWWSLVGDETAPPPEAFVVALLSYADFSAFFSSYASFTSSYSSYTAATRDYTKAGYGP
jgi:hypothetical protein